MLISCNNRCLIDVPTRIGPTSSTLIDHLYTNDVTKPVVSGVLTNFDLSDHFAIFTIISRVSSKNRQTIDYKIRDISGVRTGGFRGSNPPPLTNEKNENLSF